MEIIAEIGQNHNGDMKLAVELIHAAKEAGADCAKFQVYDAKALFPPREKNEWFDYNLKTELTRDQVWMLNDECEKVGIEFMASVFDTERIQWLEEVNAKRYKLASRSIEDKPLIEKLVATGKPLIVSLGWWKGKEFPVIPGAKHLDFLFCVSKYPTELSDIDFNRIDFKQYAGFSDHTIGLTAPIAAMARGARIIEKHFTMDRSLYGPDHVCSMDLKELRELCRFRDELRKCLPSGNG